MKKILVVVDVQNDFITGSLKNEEAKKKIPNILKKIREFDGDYILVTRDTHSKNYLETKEGKNLPVVHCVKGTWGWEIESNVAATLHDIELKDNGVIVRYIDKPTFGSFDLVGEIHKLHGAKDFEIEVLGFCTDICVVSNVMLIKAGFWERANITVDASCCAGVFPETHNAALAIMKMCQINIINE